MYGNSLLVIKNISSMAECFPEKSVWCLFKQVYREVGSKVIWAVMSTGYWLHCIRTYLFCFCETVDSFVVFCPQLWDTRKKGAAQSFQNTYQVTSVCFSDTGEQIMSGGIDNDVKVCQKWRWSLGCGSTVIKTSHKKPLVAILKFCLGWFCSLKCYVCLPCCINEHLVMFVDIAVLLQSWIVLL